MEAREALTIADLILLLGRTERATRHQDGERPETDTDHTVMLAVLALELVDRLERYATTPLGLDRGRLAMLALVHDLPEAPQGYAPAELPADAPPGARQAWAGPGGCLVITGDPDPEDEGHNCDFLGCGWEHVLELRDPQGAP